jgi:AcrR family transcriptional regulator
MSRAFDAATQQLREVAADVLVEKGARGFTLDEVARRSYVPIGTVYERWASDSEAVADVVNHVLLPGLMHLRAQTDGDDSPARVLLTTDEGERCLQLTRQTLAAATADEALAPLADLAVAGIDAVFGGGVRAEA